MKIILTMHLRQRYCERIAQIRVSKVEQFLSQNKNVRTLDAKIHADLRSAQESTRPFQIQSIAEHIVNKYGQNIKFYHSEKVIYVINEEKDVNMVVTCYDKKGYIGYFL